MTDTAALAPSVYPSSDGAPLDGPPKDSAARKLLRVLEAVSSPGSSHRLSDLVKETGLTKTSVFRLLSELIDNGYVSRTADGTYAPGRALRLLGLRMSTSTDDSDQIRTRLGRLQSDVNSTIHFALRTGDTATYIEKVEDVDQPIRMASRVGAQIPLHSTAIGKSVLAHLPEGDVRRYASSTGLPGRTPQTLTTVAALLADGEIVRNRGYSIDDEENEAHIRCMAVPVFDAHHNVVGGIGITTIAPLTPRSTLESWAPLLLTAARDVMTLL